MRQTIDDCVHEVMDLDRLTALLRRIHSGEIQYLARDLPEPSPLAHEILNAKPYAFLDDAPLEERRTQAVYTRRAFEPSSADDLGALDPAAIERVRDEAWPDVRDADELHDALLTSGFLTEIEGVSGREGVSWTGYWRELLGAGRGARVELGDGQAVWVAMERAAEVSGAAGQQGSVAVKINREDAIRELLRGRLGIIGPTTALELAGSLNIAGSDADIALAALEGRGCGPAWRLHARSGDAGVVRPPAARAHPPLHPQPAARRDRAGERGGLHAVPVRLAAGGARPAGSGSRGSGHRHRAAGWLRASRGRLGERRARGAGDGVRPDAAGYAVHDGTGGLGTDWRTGGGRSGRTGGRGRSGPRPIALFLREHADQWLADRNGGDYELSSYAAAVRDVLQQRGASFFHELSAMTGLLPTQVEQGLAELAGLGLVTSDSFAGLRALITPSSKRKPLSGAKRRHRTAPVGIETAGRWALLGRQADGRTGGQDGPELFARTLLRRYGVVFKRVLARETGAPPWRELLMVYRRLEARGEIRGGRFVAGMSGEQFALPEAVGQLRAVRRVAGGGVWWRSVAPTRSTSPGSSHRATESPPSPGTGSSIGTASR